MTPTCPSEPFDLGVIEARLRANTRAVVLASDYSMAEAIDALAGALRVTIAEVRSLTNQRNTAQADLARATAELAELRALQAEQQRAFATGLEVARITAAETMRHAVLRLERWSAGGVQAILDLDVRAVLDVATTVPDETIAPQ